MSRTFIQSWRFALVCLSIVGAFSTVLGRLVYLHVYASEELSAVAAESRRTTELLHARRGDITDSRGHLLAATRSVIELGVDPMAVDEEDLKKLPQLAKLLGTPDNELRQRFAKRYIGEGPQMRPVRWREIADAISDDLYDKVLELEIDGVYGNRKYVRVYPANESASHIVGYINKEASPVMGIERYLDFYLRGQRGLRESEKDGRRRELAQFRHFKIAPRDGLNVELTLDLVIQDIVESELARIAEEYTPESATIIVSDPHTGDILALANYPTFDPNHFWDYPLENQRNRAITDVYEPGSTFKIVAVSGALEEELVTPFTEINCGVPTVEFRGRTIRLPDDHRNLGTVPVSTVVQKSSNRGAAQLGMMLGEHNLHDYCAAFGFGRETGWGPGGEVSGTLHDVEDWDGLTISRLPAGYAVNATALQVHQAMATIANGGVRMAPRIIRRVYGKDGDTVLEFSPVERQRVISTDTADTVARMLAAVTQEGGTASRADIPGFETAGKTGTARKIIDGHYSHSHHVGSFSGFFPAENPQVVITVVVNDAQLSGPAYGGIVAAPSFRRVGESFARYIALQPSKEDSTRSFAAR